LITTLAVAGVAAGADGLFLETHPNPAEALSDGSNMLPLEQMESLVRRIIAFRQTYLMTQQDIQE
jgi:2-dehydro-3-deoxyphosphooctonate aldolase (KDO 8-P synthase)